ncbi:MAG TPA: LysR family transcriptional regulator [Symbiobacteriaceae bacterium]
MDTKLLQTFVVAARTLNFHKAAEQLFLAQPTVTQHIRQLEAELRVKLFERGGRRVRLTPAGERFLEYAVQLLDLYDRGVQEMTMWQKGYRERLVLAVSPLVARSTLPRVVRRFTMAHPDVDVVVRIAVSQEIPPLLVEGKAHVGLSRTPPNTRDLESYVWYTDPVTLVDRAEDAAGDTPPDWRKVVTRTRLLTHNHPIYWDDLLLALQHMGIHVRTMEVSQVDITKIFIEEGLGVSFLPRSTVVREVAEGRLVEVPTPDLELPVAATYVLYPAQSPSELARHFMECLEETDVP